MWVMYDSVTVDEIPASAVAVAGYTSGKWPTFATLVQRWPHAHRLSIAVNDAHDADCLDCEPGDASPDQVVPWVKRQIARGVYRPVVYSSVSGMATILNLLANAGIKREDVRIWTAHYTGVAHVCTTACGFGMPGTADATQWTDKALGRNLDESLCAADFFATRPAPPKPDPTTKLHYARYEDKPYKVNGRLIHERALVARYDELRKHGVRNRRKLAPVRRDLQLAAARLSYLVLHEPRKNGKLQWGEYHRGFRYQGLIKRANGKRFL